MHEGLEFETPTDRGLPSDEGALVVRAARGDPGAQQALWVASRAWVAAVCLAHMPREADLEDLLQDVALAFVTRVHTVRDPGAFRGWLRMIAVNAAREAGRKRSRRRRLDADAGRSRAQALPTGDTDEPGDRAASWDGATGLMAKALELPEGYREPLLLRCVRGMSYRQIGLVMDLPETTVETRIARGRRMLRELASGGARAASVMGGSEGGVR